jgi:thioesterase domain-containing protein/acyl carrier protein
MESQLVTIWERLLKVSPIGVRDDFFELGGDSLISVSLFVEIENQFGIELPLSALVGSPTIEKLATELGQGRSNGSWKYLVPLQTEGGQSPLFCMHAAGGNVLFYRDLASELGKDQPFYGLQARGVTDKSETAHDRVEDMATDYLKEIRSFQPNGPYRLCGASFGGLVAFEAARQLVAMGETVGMLALFDTYAPLYFVPGGPKSKNHPLKSLVFRVKSIRNQLREMGDWKKRLEFVRSKAVKVNKKVRRKIAWTKNQFAIEYNKATGRELPPDMMRNHAAIQTAMDGYMPGKFDGNMILFRASEQPPVANFDQHLGWDSFVNGVVTAVVVKGTHGALTVYPFATDLAARLKPFLEEPSASSRSLPQVKHQAA